MAVTYNALLATSDLDFVRFHIGDTVENDGVKPDSSNFSDTELTGLITLEGAREQAVAAAFEALNAIWTRFVDTEIGARDEKFSQVAKGYAQSAMKWRSGQLGGTGNAVNVQVTNWTFNTLRKNDDPST